MDITTLWDPLEPNKNKIEIIKKDIQDGKVPELPYFIIDQNKAKEKIGKNIAQIDGDRMLTNLLISQYGNGKTNLMKFLLHKFENSSNIKVSYLRSDVDQPDVFLFLLKEFQGKYLTLLIDSIKQIRETSTFNDIVESEDSHFIEIEDYAKKLLSLNNNDDIIKELIYLGTGRLYTKSSFKKHGIEQLKDYNRREVFALFLNILSKCSIYILFEIDEIERIREKSKIRFNHFLTSYRELYDLSSKIKGHYLLISLTDSTGANKIQEANEALYSRIKMYITELETISGKKSLNALSYELNKLFATGRTEYELGNYVSDIIKRNLVRNREIIQRLTELILEQNDINSLVDLISEKGLNALFWEVNERLEIEGGFKIINQKFFYPLISYLENNGYSKTDVKNQENYFIDNIGDKIHYFLFKDHLDEQTLNNKVNEIIESEDKKIIIYSPDKLELQYSQININSEAHQKFEIIHYNPKDLMILFTVYKENVNKQIDVSEIVRIYTKGNL